MHIDIPRLELTQSEVWGLTIILSIGGNKLSITFIDDHSMKLSVYFLKHKYGVF